MDTKEKTIRRLKRKNRIRSKVSGTAKRPRLSIFRSNTRISAQLIDDEIQTTIAFVTTSTQKGKSCKERSVEAGKEIAESAKKNNIDNVVFDRGGYLYTGNIKAFADAAREAGLIF